MNEESNMAKKSEWEIERDKQKSANEKGMKNMTADQLATIKNLKSHLGECLSNIAEMNDLLMSDVRKLDDLFHDLNRHFNMNHNYRSGD
jgi:hypothetical protein